MDAFKIAIKLYAQRDDFRADEFVPIFHRWIQTHALADHLLIDVADYAHVPNGPGTVLITSQANLSTDRTAGRLGLLYVRKLPLEGDFRQRLRQVWTAARKAAALLEADPALGGRLKFRDDEVLVRLNDRLLAPNATATLNDVRADIEAVAGEVYPGRHLKLEHTPSPLTLFEVHLSTVS